MCLAQGCLEESSRTWLQPFANSVLANTCMRSKRAINCTTEAKMGDMVPDYGSEMNLTVQQDHKAQKFVCRSTAGAYQSGCALMVDNLKCLVHLYPVRHINSAINAP